MKKLFSATNVVGKFGLLQSLLEDAGILYEVRNEGSPYPLATGYPELWVLNDEDFAKAVEIRDDLFNAPPQVEQAQEAHVELEPSPDRFGLREKSRQIAGVCFIFALGAFAFFLWNNRQIHRVKSWPTAIGWVSDVQVISSTNVISGSTGNRVETHHHLIYTFTYEVGEHRYDIKRSYFLDRTPTEQVNQRAALGRTLTVHYDPSNPAKGVSERLDFRWGSLLTAIVWVSFGSAALIWPSRPQRIAKSDRIIPG